MPGNSRSFSQQGSARACGRCADSGLLSRLLGEKFAGTPIGEHFLAGES